MPKPKTKTPKPKAHLESNRRALAEDMDEARQELEAMPDSREWTLEELDDLEGLRDSALSLSREIEAIFATLQGSP